MIKLAVSGALGRMGKAILSLAERNSETQIVLAIEDKAHPSLGQKLSSHVNLNSSDAVVVQSSDDADLNSVDVWIDFSTPEGTMYHVQQAVQAKCALVIGTTGFSKNQISQIKEASKSIPVVLAPNMSIGANVLFSIAHTVAKRLGEAYDIEIVEAHHRHKKDAPSGTAKRLAESICNAKGWDYDDVMQYGREGMTGERPQKQIGMHVIRGGEIVGEHSAYYTGPGETLELRHHAASRDAFASGAIVAAQFVAKKQKGLFDMHDVLDLPKI